MRKIFLKALLLILPLLISCHSDKKEYLSKSKFEDVLYDIHIYEAFLNDESFLPNSWVGSYDKIQNYRDLNYLNIFKKYNITDSIFFNSVAHYSKNVSTYSDIYFDLNLRINDELKRLKVQAKADRELRTKIKNLGKKDADYYINLNLPNLDSINIPISICNDSLNWYSLNKDSLMRDSLIKDTLFVKSLHYYFPESIKGDSVLVNRVD